MFRTGILRDIPGLAVAEKLPSYHNAYNQNAVVGNLIKTFTAGNPPVTIVLANKDKAVLDADYNRIINLEYSNAFFDIMPLQGYTSLTALRLGGRSLRGQRVPGIALLAMLAVVAVLALALPAISRRNVPDGTEYLILN